MKIIPNSVEFIQQMKLFDSKERCFKNFILWPRQVEYINLLHKQHQVTVVKKRQVAGTTLTLAELLVRCMCIERYLALVLSKTGEDAVECIRRAKQLYNSLPDVVNQASPFTKKDQPMDSLEFKNGSRMLSLPANKGAGYTADAVFIDEGAHITTKESHITLEEVMLNLGPTLDWSDGQLIICGTAHGLGRFHDSYKQAKMGRSMMKAFFFSCWDDPTFTKERRDLLEHTHDVDYVNENYPRDDVEAFVASGNCRFNIPVLQEKMAMCEEGEVGYLERVGDKVVFRKNDRGWLVIFEHPKRGKAYLGGFDTSEGIKVERDRPTDPSAGVIFDSKMNQVARIRAWLEPDIFAEEIMRIADYYKDMLIGIERNKDGLGVLKIIKNKGNYTLYYQEEFNKSRQSRERKLGWYTNSVTKPLLESKLSQMMREDTINIKDYEVLSELMTYVRHPNGTTGSQEGCHDDLAISCMIATMILPFAPDPSENLYEKGRDYQGFETKREEPVTPKRTQLRIGVL